MFCVRKGWWICIAAWFGLVVCVVWVFFGCVFVLFCFSPSVHQLNECPKALGLPFYYSFLLKERVVIQLVYPDSSLCWRDWWDCQLLPETSPGTQGCLPCHSFYVHKISNKIGYLQIPAVISTCPHDSSALSLTSFHCDVWWTSELSSVCLPYQEQLPLLGPEWTAGHRCCLKMCFGSLLIAIDLWWSSVFSTCDDWVSSTLGSLMTGVGGMWTRVWVIGLYKEGSRRSQSCT